MSWPGLPTSSAISAQGTIPQRRQSSRPVTAGRRPKSLPGSAGGVAYASGDGDPGDQDHGTFFNMVPTNHKFYGDQDLSALQNLTNVYVQLRLQPHRRLALSFEVHLFRLSDAADAWYGGSGAANNQGFGYVARFPGGRTRRDIGTEWDLILTWSPRP